MGCESTGLKPRPFNLECRSLRSSATMPSINVRIQNCQVNQLSGYINLAISPMSLLFLKSPSSYNKIIRDMVDVVFVPDDVEELDTDRIASMP